MQIAGCFEKLSQNWKGLAVSQKKLESKGLPWDVCSQNFKKSIWSHQKSVKTHFKVGCEKLLEARKVGCFYTHDILNKNAKITESYLWEIEL